MDEIESIRKHLESGRLESIQNKVTEVINQIWSGLSPIISLCFLSGSKAHIYHNGQYEEVVPEIKDQFEDDVDPAGKQIYNAKFWFDSYVAEKKCGVPHTEIFSFPGALFLCSISLNIKKEDSNFCRDLPRQYTGILVPTSLFIEAACACNYYIYEYIKSPDRHALPFFLDEKQIAKDAAGHLVERCFAGGADVVYEGGIVYDCLNSVSLKSYEKLAAKGSVLALNVFLSAEALRVCFADPIKIRDTSLFRKVLEGCSGGESLAVHNYSIYGYVVEKKLGEDVMVGRVNLHSPGKWSLDVQELCMMSVDHNEVSCNKKSVQSGELQDELRAVFKNSDERYFQKLLNKLGHIKKGGLIIISDKAQSEADRFGSECFKIVKKKLDVEQLASLCQVDGAIILDPSGTCYAFGVILDGVSDGEGDPGRGSRYNSTIRYCKTQIPNYNRRTVGIVVSEDGMIDVKRSLGRS